MTYNSEHSCVAAYNQNIMQPSYSPSMLNLNICHIYSKYKNEFVSAILQFFDVCVCVCVHVSYLCV